MNNEHIAKLRLFNRFYTSVIGLLDKQYLNSDFSLTEVRILYELAHRPQGMTATELVEMLGLDKGYLSRMLQVFEKKKLITKKQSDADKRAFFLCLSPAGNKVFAGLNYASQQHASALLSSLGDSEAADLIGHMDAIRNIFENSAINKK
jgi:DNA-binding MarR family transcriptional regulator